VPGQEDTKCEVIGTHPTAIGVGEVLMRERGVRQHLIPVFKSAVVEDGEICTGKLVDRVDDLADVALTGGAGQ